MPNSETPDFFREATPNSITRSRSVTVVESDSRNATLVAGQVQVAACQRVLVRVTSVRTRLLDEDNLCEKYHVDLLRYAGIISGDEAGKTKIEVAQRKARKGEKEHTLIEVFEA